jgi:hypothetical protein
MRGIKNIGINLEKSFWSKVNKTEGCWIWTAGKNHDGYGYFRHNNSHSRAHRVSYQLHFGDIPRGLFICHKCDNRSCVNPSHLFVGTAKENSVDMKEKGRSCAGEKSPSRRFPENYQGEKSGMHKLKLDEVMYIKSSYGKNGHTQTSLAKQFGVTQSAVWCVLRGKTWSHVKI